MKGFFDHVWSVCPYSDELTDRLTEYITLHEYPRKSHVLTEGKVCKRLYIVEDGVFRKYHIKRGKEVSSAFMLPGDLCIDPESFLTQQPSHENIETQEGGRLHSITYDHLQEICADFPEVALAVRKQLEGCISWHQHRYREMWMQRSGDKYDWYLTQPPLLQQSVPARHAASYLGLTEVTLSVLKHGRENWKGRIE
jgi:CRP-like cAMP-binding protein